jgi:hypothetical protein
MAPSIKLLTCWFILSTVITTIIGFFNLALAFSIWGLELDKISQGPPVVHIILGLLTIVSGACGLHGVLKRNPLKMGFFNICNLLLFSLFLPFGVLLVFYGKKIKEEMICDKEQSLHDCVYENNSFLRDDLNLIESFGIIVLTFAAWMLQNFIMTVFICTNKHKSDLLLRKNKFIGSAETETKNQELKQNQELRQVQEKNTKYQLVNNTTEANETKV